MQERTGALCGLAIPFGFPVVPDEYETKARLSWSTSGPLSPAGTSSSPSSQPSSRKNVSVPSGRRSAYRSCVRTTRGLASATTSASKGGEASDHVLGPPLHVNTDGFVRADAQAPEIRREAVSKPVQLAVGQGDVGAFEGKELGRAARLLLEELVQAEVSGIIHPSAHQDGIRK